MTTTFRTNRIGGLVTMMAVLLFSFWILPANLYAAEEDKNGEDELPEVEEVELPTSDGLKLFLNYYPGTKGKKTVPVVILHDIGESAQDYASLSLYLQKKGHAVLLVDIRGHGQSTQRKPPRGRPQEIHGKRLNENHVRQMVLADMRAIRKFLLQENNAEKLNIEKLCLVGTGACALVAMNYAVVDWGWEDLAFQKQGKDVRALVLISPSWGYKKLSAKTFIENRNLRGQLSILLMVGRDDKKAFKASTSIHKLLARFYPEPKEKEAAKAKALFFYKRDTVLQGEKLLNTAEFKCENAISAFIKARLVSKKIPWTDRTPK